MKGVVVVVLAVLPIMGCGTEADNSSGPAVPHQFPGESYPGVRETVGGTVRVAENGCWNVDDGSAERMVVWPAGSDLGATGTEVVLTGGAAVPSGAVVSGDGAIVAITELPGGPDGYWAMTTSYCSTSEQTVVVFDDVAVITDGASPPVLDVEHGCGFGFTVASMDQQAALLLYPQQRPTSGEVGFPSAEWVGVLQIGHDLMANWCDDVVEPGEPIPLVLAEWPVVAGSIRFDPPGELTTGCGVGAVTAEVTALEVAPANGRLPIDLVTITNEAYGCFAG